MSETRLTSHSLWDRGNCQLDRTRDHIIPPCLRPSSPPIPCGTERELSTRQDKRSHHPSMCETRLTSHSLWDRGNCQLDRTRDHIIPPCVRPGSPPTPCGQRKLSTRQDKRSHHPSMSETRLTSHSLWDRGNCQLDRTRDHIIPPCLRPGSPPTPCGPEETVN